MNEKIGSALKIVVISQNMVSGSVFYDHNIPDTLLRDDDRQYNPLLLQQTMADCHLSFAYNIQ